MNKINDETIALFSKGDRKAFDAIFDDLYESIHFFSLKLTKSPFQGEEIAMEAFMALWKCHDMFNTIDHVRAFLYVTARNAGLNFLRKEKAQRIFYQNFKNFSRNWEADHENKMIQAEVLKELLKEINSLPGKCREVFKLRYLEGKSREEVAKELNMAIATVDSHSTRAFKLLRSRILKSQLRFISFVFMSLASLAFLLKKIF